MTAFLQCFWILSQIGVASNRNLVSSFGKASEPLCTECSWTFSYFQNVQKLEPGFQFFIFQSQKLCFEAWGRLGMSNNLPNYLPVWKCSVNLFWSVIQVDRIYLEVDLGLPLFHKWHKHIGIYKKQAKPTISKFVVWNCLLNCLWFYTSGAKLFLGCQQSFIANYFTQVLQVASLCC